MLMVFLIGNIGGDAQLQTKDGRKFTTFRVAHNDRWTDQDGNVHDSTMWVDCIVNDHPKVAEYLKAGATVCVIGRASTRLYSSAKDRCMKAGLTVNVERIELVGGKADSVPGVLYDTNGVEHKVIKYYFTDVASAQLFSRSNRAFQTDQSGWVSPVVTSEQPKDEETLRDNPTA